MPTLKQIVEESNTPAGRAFDLTILTLIMISLFSFSLETMPNLSETTRLWLERFETLSVIAFSLEYLLRVYVASPKKSYVFSFFGLVDLAAILPFFIGLQFDLRSVRALRLLRLFRILKLARYSAAARRFHRALIIAKEEIVLFLGAALIICISPPSAFTNSRTTPSRKHLARYFTVCGGRSQRLRQSDTETSTQSR